MTSGRPRIPQFTLSLKTLSEKIEPVVPTEVKSHFQTTPFTQTNKMSHLDTELASLRLRLAALEEQKRIETEKADKKAFPLKALEGIIDEHRNRIDRNSYSKSLPLARFYDQEKVSFLEPIFDMLKDIQRRLEILEKRE